MGKTVKIAPFLKSYFKNNIPFFVVANLVLWDLTFTQKLKVFVDSNFFVCNKKLSADSINLQDKNVFKFPQKLF